MKLKYFILYIVIVISIIICGCNKADNKQPIKQSEVNNLNAMPREEQLNLIKLTDSKTVYKHIHGELIKSNLHLDNNMILSQKEKIRCNEFLNDFTNHKNIEIIEPTVYTNNFKDEKLQLYWKKCPYFAKRLNKYIPYSTGSMVYPVDKQENYQRSESYYTYGHYNYRLFDIDIDNNAKNGKQALFYAGGFYHSDNLKSIYNSVDDLFFLIDFKSCKVNRIEDFKATTDPYTLKSTGLYNGIVKYQSKYYIFEYNSNKKETKKIDLLNIYKWDKKNNNINYKCRYNK